MEEVLYKPYWLNVAENLGLDLGELEDYQLTKTSARVRVLLDGLQPIIKEYILELPAGDEALLTFDYEKLGNHCSICNRLSHLRSHCPDRTDATMQNPRNLETVLPQETTRSTRGSAPRCEPPQDTRAYDPNRRVEPERDPFQQRVDRHGRPFGQRVATTSTTRLLLLRLLESPEMKETYKPINCKRLTLTELTTATLPPTPQEGRTETSMGATTKLRERRHLGDHPKNIKTGEGEL